MEVIETQPEIDYVKIGQRIRAARLEKGYSQADLGALCIVLLPGPRTAWILKARITALARTTARCTSVNT